MSSNKLPIVLGDLVSDTPWDDQTLIGLFHRRCREWAGQVGLRHKHLGIWAEVTWGRMGDEVRSVAAFLRSQGVGRGDRVMVLADTTPEWLYTDLACQALGALTVGVFTTAPPTDVAYVAQDSAPRVVLVGDQEHFDKFRSAEEIAGRSLTDVLVVVDPDGIDLAAERVVALSDGVADRSLDDAAWSEMCEGARPGDPCAVFYTSGTTGRPKGAVLSSQNLFYAGAVLGGELRNGRLGRSDRTVAFIPMAHVIERIVSEVCPIVWGSVPHFPETPDLLEQAFYEVSPTLVVATPRTWEVAAARIRVGMLEASRVKRGIYTFCLRLRRFGLAGEPANGDGRARGALRRRFGRAVAAATRPVLARPLLDKFGYAQARNIVSGGAPLSGAMASEWLVWGMDIRQVYGQTECGGFATYQRDADSVAGAVGRPLPHSEVAVDDNGEILVRSPGVFLRYWGTVDSPVDDDGWLKTGDAGFWLPNGELAVLDRQGAMLDLGGTQVPAAEVELLVKMSPYIIEAAAVADGGRVLALVEMNFPQMSEWARRNNVPYTSYASLSLRPEVTELLAREIADASRELQARGRPVVADFRVLPQELDPETSDLVTPTRKLRREAVERHYAWLVDEMRVPVMSSDPVTQTGGVQ